MQVFRDSNGDEWRVQLDAFGIEDVRKETGINLADRAASGWFAVDSDSAAAVRVLAVLCGDEIRAGKKNSRAFARGIRGEALDRARSVLQSEGADFFPPSEWSEMLSNLERRKTATRAAEDLRIAMAGLEVMPSEMRAGAATALAEMMTKASGSSDSQGPKASSVTGQDATPASSVTSTPEKSASPLAA